MPAARGSAGLPLDQVIDRVTAAGREFGEQVRAKFRRDGEW